MGKKLRDEDLVLNIIVNGDKGQKEILDLEKAIKQTNRELNKLEKERQALLKSGQKESAQYKAVTAAIELKNSALDKARGRIAQLRQGLDLLTMTTGDLKNEMTRLKKLIDVTKPDTPEWTELDARLKRVKERFHELNGTADKTAPILNQLFPSSMIRNFVKAVGIFKAAEFVFREIAQVVGPIVEKYAVFDDKLADVRKTTNLTNEELHNLNENIKDIDTRTAQLDLLDLARVAGKLGIAGESNVLGFVKAADQIGVALSEDLGEDIEGAIRDVGKLVDIFNVREEFGIEKGLLKVGSVINGLGVNSTAQEEYMVDFTKRLAGVAPAANISIASVLGMSSTLDQLGQSAEVAGTTMVNLIPDMFTNPEKFAKIAGIELNEFNKLLNNDTNEALIKLFEGVKGNEEGMSAMAARLVELGLDGARATNIVSALVNNTALLRSEQALAIKLFQDGTSVTQEFAIKNETLAASIAKITRYFSNLFLNSTMLDGLRDFVGGFADWLTISDKAARSFEDQKKVVDDLDATIPDLLERYEQLNKVSYRSTEQNIELRDVINQIAAAVPTAVTGFNSYGEALDINTGKVNEFIEAQRLMLQYTNREAIKEGKEGLIDTLTEIEKITRALNRKDADGDLAKLINKTTGFQSTIEEVKLTAEEITELQRKLAQFREKERQQRLLIDGFSGVITPTDGTNTKKKPINPDDLLTEEQKAAQAAAAKAAEAERKRKEKEAEAERERERKAQEKLLEDQADFRRKAIEGQLALAEQERLAHERRLVQAGLFGKKEADMTTEELQALEALEIQYQNNLNDITSKSIDQRLKEKESAYKSELQALKTLHNEEYKSFQTVEQIKDFLRGKVTDDALDGIKTMRQAQTALDKIYLQEEEELTRQYLATLMQELQGLVSTGALEGVDLANEFLTPEQKAELEAKIADIKELMSQLGLASSTREEEDRGLRSKKTDILGFSQADWEIFFENIQNAELSGKELFDTLVMGAQAAIGMYGQYAAFVSAGEKRELQEYESGVNKKKDYLKNQLDAQVISQDQYNNQIAKLEADLDKKKAVFDRNEAKRERNVALMSAIVNTAAGVAEALPNIPLSILVGVLGLTQIGTILKTPLPEIPGAESGGFLSSVRRSQDGKMFRAKVSPDKRGYIESPTVITGESGDEFVANNQAVTNPTVKPVLDIINTAQEQGRISSLDLFKVLEQSKMLSFSAPGRQRGGRIRESSGVSGRSTADAMLPEVVNTLRRNERIMAKLSAQLDYPLPAEVVLTGRNSLEDKQRELDIITKSASL
tara:strand:+ start:28123 stop:31983 length:3861 start_codon:yes stop_codon:yes gene_type:complete